MNYIDIKEAVKLTGKSDKTIRRLLSKDASRPFINNIDGKLFVNVNYLFDCYPAINNIKNEGGQVLDISNESPLNMSIVELQNKIALYEQELKHKDELLAEKEGRIGDLQKAMLLLNPSTEQPKKKKSWWSF